MHKSEKLTTKAFGFFILIAAAVFVIMLMLFTINELAPVTKSRIEDCNSRITDFNASLEQYEKEGLDENNENVKFAKGRVELYTNRIKMLENREKSYTLSMAFVVCILTVAAAFQYIKTATFRRRSIYTSEEEICGYYYPKISALLAAFGILMAIGITYRTIFSIELFDLIMLVGAVFVGFVFFLIYRRAPYIEAKLKKRRLKKFKKITLADILFFLPVVGVLMLLAVNVLFGVEYNGSMLWISIGGTTIQPGEFVKVLLIILFASSYGKMWRAVVSVFTAGAAFLVLLYLKDLGTGLVIFAMVIVLLLLQLDNKMSFSIFENRKLVILLMVLAVCFFVVAMALFPHARERIENVGNAMENTERQQAEMLRALIFGGLGGLGLENSNYIINIFSINSDMAIAGLTAVFGVGMLLIVLLCYSVIIVVPVRKYSLHRQFYFAASQVSIVLVVQVILNALGSVDVLPFTGIVAPFISDGGSALVSFCAMIGIVLATLHPQIKSLEVSGR